MKASPWQCYRIVATLLLCACVGGQHLAALDLSKLPEVDPSTAVSAPRPEYPYEARMHRRTGTGVAVMEVDTSTGKVKRAYMAVSTGSKILDHAAVDAFNRWRFKPGSAAAVKSPISFMAADGGGGANHYSATRSMDDVLAAFLGKGTVVKGPVPAYPRSAGWTHKRGKGVYELRADKDGKVQHVRVLKSSSDVVFDEEAVKTLGKWRLRRGPLIIELPLSFTLTPTSYSVDVAR
jgi:TonB family protein